MLINLIKNLYYKLISPNSYAVKVGVNVGKNCHLRTKNFGSEPYMITLGDNVSTSANVQFVTHDGSLHVIRNLYNEHQEADILKPIKIGNNVFIGINAIILAGTIIENNVIVGAGSVVKGHLKENSVYAGIPAKFICSLDKYVEKNKQNFVNTKQLTYKEKRKFILEINNE